MVDKNIVTFPNRPFDGMIFNDPWKRRWVYDSRSNTWRFDGFAPDIPLADSKTVGLLSPQYKQLINSISEKAGGFGIVTKFSFGKTRTNGFNGVLSGDIKLVSNSFDITCVNSPSQPELNRHPVIDINFSEDFLDGLCVEVPSEKGPRGRKGIKGEPGETGTGDGPQGLPGTSGIDAIGISTLDEMEVVFDESFYSKAVTEVFLDSENAILSVTKSDALVPDEDTPASEVVTSPMSRDIVFNDENTFDYTITTVPGVSDPVESSVDPVVLAYGTDFNPEKNRKLKVASSGCCCEEADSAELISRNLSDYIDQSIQKLVDSINDINEEYDQELKEYIFKKDEEARKALDVLVQKLSEEEFNEEFQYCMSLLDNGVCGQCQCNALKKFSTDPYNNSGRFATTTLDNINISIQGLYESLGTGNLSLISGQSNVAKNTNSEIINSFDIPTLSQNSELVSQNVQAYPTASTFDQFTTGVCAFAQSILEASGFGTTDSADFCKNSATTNLGVIKLNAGDTAVINSSAGPTLVAGSYVLQYRNGTIYDPGNPTCGYVVGTGHAKLGLVVTKFTSNGNIIEETEIPWPASSLTQNPLSKEDVQESYLLGPITELAVGVIVNDGDRITVEAVVESDNASGQIELSAYHCSRCVS